MESFHSDEQVKEEGAGYTNDQLTESWMAKDTVSMATLSSVSMLETDSMVEALEVSDQTQLAVAINRLQFKLPLILSSELHNLSLPMKQMRVADLVDHLHVDDEQRRLLLDFDEEHDDAYNSSCSFSRLRVRDSKSSELLSSPKIVSDMSFASLVNHVSTEDAKDDVYLLLAHDHAKRLRARLYCTATWIHLMRGSMTISYCPMKEEVGGAFRDACNDDGRLLSFEDEWLEHKIQLQANQTMFMPAGFVVALSANEKTMGVEGSFLNSLNLSNQLRSFNEQERLGVSNCLCHSKFKALHWGFGRKTAASRRLTNVDDNHTSALNHLAKEMANWLEDEKDIGKNEKDSQGNIGDDRGEVLRRLRRLILEAESSKLGQGNRVSLRRNKAMKRMQSDFMDTDEAVIEDNNQQLAKAKAAKLANKQAKATIKLTIKTPSTTATITKTKTTPTRTRAKTKTSVVTMTTATAETTPSGSLDPKDQDSVRQLLLTTSKEADTNAKRSVKVTTNKLKKSTFNSLLNDELGSLITSFKKNDESDNDEDLILDESSKKVKIIDEQSELSNEVHEDDDFVYPTLDFSSSDEETRVTSLNPRDKAWTPKVRIKGVSGRISKSRSNAKKIPVQKGLKMASQRLSAKKKKRKKDKSSTHRNQEDMSKSKLVPAPSLMSMSSYDDSIGGLQKSRETDRSNSVRATRKGMATAKQRLGKILKLKF